MRDTYEVVAERGIGATEALLEIIEEEDRIKKAKQNPDSLKLYRYHVKNGTYTHGKKMGGDQ